MGVKVLRTSWGPPRLRPRRWAPGAGTGPRQCHGSPCREVAGSPRPLLHASVLGAAASAGDSRGIAAWPGCRAERRWVQISAPELPVWNAAWAGHGTAPGPRMKGRAPRTCRRALRSGCWHASVLAVAASAGGRATARSTARAPPAATMPARSLGKPQCSRVWKCRVLSPF